MKKARFCSILVENDLSYIYIQRDGNCILEIYLDNSATTRVSPTVLRLVCNMMTESYGNPSSLHHMGFVAEQAVTAARGQVAAVMGASAEEIIFTSCGSEANNLALLGGCRAARRSGNKVITTATEHHSVLAAVDALSREGFTVVKVLPGTDGCVTPEAVAQEVDEDTVMVSVMHVNSETGSINDIAAIAAAVRRKNPKTLVHCDCVQSFCRLPVTPARWGVDLATVSGHKIHAPKGVAALYRRKGLRLLPLYYGSAQEGGLHPGTENTPAICGMGLAAQELWGQRDTLLPHLATLKAHLLAELQNIPGVCINSTPNGAPYIVNISLPGVGSEVMIHYLEQYEIYLSGGSACAKGAKSHVLTAMGLPPQRITGALRISLCADNTTDQLDLLVEKLKSGLATLARK